jgi:hypothetical protein
VYNSGGHQIWARDLHDGTKAVALVNFNSDGTPAPVTLNFQVNNNSWLNLFEFWFRVILGNLFKQQVEVTIVSSLLSVFHGERNVVALLHVLKFVEIIITHSMKVLTLVKTIGISSANVRDLYLHRELGRFDGQFTANVDPHGVVMVKLTPTS